jgi:hypothetical protein
MSRVRLTYFFELGDTGWSESIHTTLAPASVTALQTLVTNYTNVRLPLLNQDAQLTHVRVSDDDTFRDIIFFPTGLPAPGTATGFPAGPWTGVLIRMIASSTLRRSLFLRGVPANCIDGRNQHFTPAFQAAMNAYLAFLSPANPVGISGKTANPSVAITQAVGATGVLTGTAILAGATVGSIIQITGVPTSILPVRFYRAIAFSGFSVTLAGWPSTVSLVNQGFMRLTTKSVVQITAASAGLITERKVGRPFGQLRGRARR